MRIKQHGSITFTIRHLAEQVGAPTEEEVDAGADQVTAGREAMQDHGEVTDPLKLHLPVYGMGHSSSNPSRDCPSALPPGPLTGCVCSVSVIHGAPVYKSALVLSGHGYKLSWTGYFMKPAVKLRTLHWLLYLFR